MLKRPREPMRARTILYAIALIVWTNVGLNRGKALQDGSVFQRGSIANKVTGYNGTDVGEGIVWKKEKIRGETRKSKQPAQQEYLQKIQKKEKDVLSQLMHRQSSVLGDEQKQRPPARRTHSQRHQPQQHHHHHPHPRRHHHQRRHKRHYHGREVNTWPGNYMRHQHRKKRKRVSLLGKGHGKGAIAKKIRKIKPVKHGNHRRTAIGKKTETSRSKGGSKKSEINRKEEHGKNDDAKAQKRTMVMGGGPRQNLNNREHVHLSPILLNAIKLVLDKRNYFKKDTNALQLASALQNKEGRFRAMTKIDSPTSGVSQGMTKNGHRVRMVRVKDPGYGENIPMMPKWLGGYRSSISKYQKKLRSRSALVNPTELGISILKLLFGKRASLVTKPEYKSELERRPEMRLLAGYGSPIERERLQKKIENENRLILLRGVEKEQFSKSLATSISDLIKAMTKGESKPELKNGFQKTLSKLRKPHATVDQRGTRKSWVLLKIPKGTSDTVNRIHHNEAEEEGPTEPANHETRISTLGKHNNMLSDVKVIRRPKHKSQSYNEGNKELEGDVKASSSSAGEEIKKLPASLANMNIDTDARAVPQIISNTKQRIKIKQSAKTDSKPSTTLSDKSLLSPGSLAFSLGKILQAIEASIKELRSQKSTPQATEGSPVIKMASPMTSTALSSMTIPEMTSPIKSELPSSSLLPQTTSSPPEMTSQASKGSAAAAIPDLLSAVNKLLGTEAIKPVNLANFAKNPSDGIGAQSTSVDVPIDESRLRPSVGQAASATRRFTAELGTEMNPLAIRPSLSMMDEPITRTNARMKPEDNVLFESDNDLGTPMDRQASIDAVKLKEDLEAFAERGLQVHNRYRVDHHAPPLIWSDKLATQAEKLAYDMAMKGVIERSEVASRLGYGENVAKIVGTMFNKAGEVATTLWYAEGKNYSFSDPRLSPTSDAFTQVVWKATKKLGMGCARDLQTNDLYVVALYDPKGNDPVGLRSNVVNMGGVTQDVYASIFKRHRLNPSVPTMKILKKLLSRTP